MPVPFSEITEDTRLPLVYIELNNVTPKNIPRLFVQNLLYIGPKGAGAKATAAKIYELESFRHAKDLFGAGSPVTAMAQKAFLKTSAGKSFKIFGLTYDDAAAAAASEATLTVAVANQQAGLLIFEIGGRSYNVTIADSDDLADVRTKIIAAINNDSNAYVTAADGTAAGEIDLESKFKGTIANLLSSSTLLDVEGVTLTHAAFANGAGDFKPEGDTAQSIPGFLDIAPDTDFQFVVIPEHRATVESYIKPILRQRFSAQRKSYTGVLAGSKQNFTTIGTIARALDDEFYLLLDCAGRAPEWEHAAAAFSQIASTAGVDAGVPQHSYDLESILGPGFGGGLSFDERNSLVNDGVGVTKPSGSDGRRVTLEKIVTTSKTVKGEASEALKSLERLLILNYIRWHLTAILEAKFSRFKLSKSEGVNYEAGQKVLTPNTLRGELLAIYEGWSRRGLVQDVEAFSQSLIVEIDPNNKNRVNVALTADLIGQLDVIAILANYL